MPQSPRSRLQAATIVTWDRNGEGPERYLKGRTQACAEGAPVVGCGAEAVVDMRGGKLEAETLAQAHENLQQHDRIDPARKRDAQPRPGTHPGHGENGRDRRNRIRFRRRPVP